MFYGIDSYPHGLYYVDRDVEYVHDMSGEDVELDEDAFSDVELDVLMSVLRAAMRTVNHRITDTSAYSETTHGAPLVPFPTLAPFGLYYVTTNGSRMVSAVDRKLLPMSPLEVAVLQPLVYHAAKLACAEKERRQAKK